MITTISLSLATAKPERPTRTNTMKKSLHSSFRYIAMGLVATGLTGATLVWSAPKLRRSASSAAVKTPAPSSSPRKSAPGASAPKVVSSVVLKPGTVPASQPEVGFTPSRFPGVKVRHIPDSKTLSLRIVKAKPHRGLVLGKPRPIPGHRGTTVDVDPSSFPSESVQVPPAPSPAKKVPQMNSPVAPPR